MKADASHKLLIQADELGHEARAGQGDHAVLRLWLRMLSCTTQIEDEIRRRLRVNFDISLARFDYMAQLYRQPEGLMMKELSRYLMVTGGNITGLTDELEREALVVREPSPTDRRSWIVRLTDKGRDAFSEMARQHELWIHELFGGLDAKTAQTLHAQLGSLRVHVMHARANNEDNNP
ncbi:MAG: MarR family transcriptional regulator [Aquabacterium sp.]|jgi:DNA-binding MarR family transcriptional regulator|uniref:MarR family winged helix-turn-helix transcriptional regulator n=1 Tax=Aquabacterium sp. TaxID=1872578 RepID=UPI003BB197D5